MMIPRQILTSRLVLRSWHASDARRLQPILEQNVDHLRHWIPAAVYSPAPLEELEARLNTYAADFQADRAWRYATFLAESGDLIGETSLFPRSAGERVPLEDADRVEIGYWLRVDVLGRGYATEAAQALLGAASQLPALRCVEIRCDSRNVRSADVPRRLGFSLDRSGRPNGGTDMVWQLLLTPSEREPPRA